MSGSSDDGLNIESLSFSDRNFELLKKEYKRLKMNNSEQMIAIKLNSVANFVSLFYAEITVCPTKTEAFNKLNDLYFDYYGEYRFLHYQNFLKAMNKYLKLNRET